MIHGDIKPSNMLVDPQNRVKLGDFGLARRASNEEGSLLKGTTKYMAPELLSPQFGAVGPASDLYSLGFSAYELMCGKQFESLFPGLGTFGRDKQIAWMMWHAAADRNLPAIDRVLEGVPDDLAHVIQRLVVKDQSQRYRSAKDALWDLRVSPLAGLPRPEDVEAAAEAAKAAAAKRKRRKRFAAILSVACSLVLSVAMYVWLSQPPPGAAPSAVDRRRRRQHLPQGVDRGDCLGQRRQSQGRSSAIRRRRSSSMTSDVCCAISGRTTSSSPKLDKPGRKIKEIRAIRPDIASGLVKEVKAAENRIHLCRRRGRGKEQRPA